MINRTFAVASLLGILSACGLDTNEGAEANAAPIVGGNLESEHPAVGHIKYTEVNADGVKGIDGDLTCTGTLVTPNVLLTAAHCIVPSTPGARYVDHKVIFSTGDVFEGTFQIYIASATKAVAHPKYDPKVFGDFDVGVIELDQDIPIQPVKVARTLGDVVGKDVTHVGYGFGYANGANDKGGLGVKRSVTLPVTRQSPNDIVTGNGKSGFCNGDSGGPALFHAPSGEQIIVAVHSWIDDNDYCLKNGYSSRSDRYVDFLAPYMLSAFVDVSDEVEPPPIAGNGAFSGSCCLNGECYSCNSKSAHDRCVGFDLNACFSECGTNASCLFGCADRVSTATRDPSACEKLPSSKAPQGEIVPQQNGTSCSLSVSCTNGRCYCGGEKAGAPCESASGLPNSCSVVCRVCK